LTSSILPVGLDVEKRLNCCAIPSLVPSKKRKEGNIEQRIAHFCIRYVVVNVVTIDVSAGVAGVTAFVTVVIADTVVGVGVLVGEVITV